MRPTDPIAPWAKQEDYFDDAPPRVLKERNCMTCSVKFLSEGAHNRLCDRCRVRGHQFELN